MKPHLACDWTDARIEKMIKESGYAMVLPKIDGVRGCNLNGMFTGRSLKRHGNKFVGQFYDKPMYEGIDGELAAESETHPDLCRITTSAVNTHEGTPYTLLHAFDFLREDVKHLPYEARYLALAEYLGSVQFLGLDTRVRVVTAFTAFSLDEVMAYDEQFLDLGYEGSIVRDPRGMHKDGRCTVREGAYLRIKRFVDFEFKVHTIIEGEENLNVAQINELGRTFRTSHQENKVPNGMIGAMLGVAISDVYDGSTLLFSKGQEVKVSAGCLSHEQRKYYFQHQDQFKALLHKAKFFPKGLKDKPRFPTWQSFRSLSDMPC